MAPIVAAWLAGTLRNAIVVSIGKTNTIPIAAKQIRAICLLVGNGYFPASIQPVAIIPAPTALARAINPGSNPPNARRAVTNDKLKQTTPIVVKIQPCNSL
jgi:hypothetical protein